MKEAKHWKKSIEAERCSRAKGRGENDLGGCEGQ